MHSKTHNIAELAIFTALAFIFSYLESLFPLPIPFPGIKLGLANLVIVILLYRSGFTAALGVSLVRNLLNALTFGSLFGLFYSLAGSILSLFAMEGLRRIKRFHPGTVIVSTIGGILHNLGQFLVASALVGYEAILRYFPFLYFAGLIAGILIGIFAEICLKKLPLLSNRS
jgi:heptaprenyl diphosphate synthase